MKTLNDPTDKIIFSNDGIRGISGKWPFNNKGTREIAAALAEFVLSQGTKTPLVVLGRDSRRSGKIFCRILSDCFLARGIHVIDLGIAPTPVVSYATKKEGAELGVIISASHNPPEYNGIKLLNSTGLRLSTGDEAQLKMLLNSDHIDDTKGFASNASFKKWDGKNIIDEYINSHVGILGSECLKGLRLTVDCANGATSLTASQLLTRLGATVVTIGNDLSGANINMNCGSEYTRKDPVGFILQVKRDNTDYGLAFDGDGDRIVVVDKSGNFYNGDDLLYTLAIHYSARDQLPRKTIVTTELSNSALEFSLQKIGVHTLYTKNGDKNLENLMWSNGFLLGGEQVGNLILNDGIHSAADPLYAIASIFKELKLSKKSLEERTKAFRKYPQVSASVFLRPKVPLNEVDHLKDDMEKNGQLGIHLRVKYWYSSTEAGLFNVMMEGVESDKPESIRKQAYIFCQKVLRLNGSSHKEVNVLDVSSRKRL